MPVDKVKYFTIANCRNNSMPCGRRRGVVFGESTDDYDGEFRIKAHKIQTEVSLRKQIRQVHVLQPTDTEIEEGEALETLRDCVIRF